MSRRNQWIAFAGLVVILGAVVYLNRRQSGGPGGAFSASDTAAILAVDNPQIRMDKIARIRAAKYSGTRRNIFSLAPPPLPPRPIPKPAPAPDPVSVAPPPLVLPVKFFGYAADTQGNHRRACFTNGDEVIIVEEGDTLLGKYRVLRISSTTLDFEEMSSGRRASAKIEEQAPAA
jgi:hypothetical protein